MVPCRFSKERHFNAEQTIVHTTHTPHNSMIIAMDNIQVYIAHAQANCYERVNSGTTTAAEYRCSQEKVVASSTASCSTPRGVVFHHDLALGE